MNHAGRGVLLAFLLTGVTTARAAEPSLSLDVSRCDRLDAPAVEQIAGVELRARIEGDDAESATHVRIVCDEATAKIEVHDRITGKIVMREVDLLSVDERARDRLVALSVGELVAASWLELTTRKGSFGSSGAVDVEPEAAAARERAERWIVPRRSSRRSLELGTHATGRILFARGTMLLGAGIEVASRGRPFGFSLDASVERGEESASIGEVRLTTASFGGYLVAGGERGRVAGWLGVGVRAGAGFLAGRPEDSARAIGMRRAGPWGGPSLRVGGLLELGRGVLFRASVEAGWALVSLYGTVDGAREVRVGGPFGAVFLGLGWRP